MAKSIKLKDNTYIDSSSIVYNKNKLSEILTYFTDEKIVGTWINNKPIYRKVFSLNKLANNSTLIISHDINNLGIVIAATMTWYDTTDNRWLVSPRIEDLTINIKLASIDNQKIYIPCKGVDWSIRTSNVNIILEYTKTI